MSLLPFQLLLIVLGKSRLISGNGASSEDYERLQVDQREEEAEVGEKTGEGEIREGEPDRVV